MGHSPRNVKISETIEDALANYEVSSISVPRSKRCFATRANIGDRLTAQRRLVDATNTTYKLSNARFRAGIDSYLTVLDVTFLTAEQGLLLLQQADLNNQVELYKTLGGGVKATSSETVSTI